MPSTDSHQGHRTDIQALRAIAVAAVLLYHLWPRLVPGGYVGVDVFFVVSGFLITGLLVAELEATGRVDLLRFYARRIRRLLPSALLVLAVTFATLLVVVPPVAWPANLAEISAACAYLLNLVLAASNADYLAADAAPTLVQHYWSLSLEEQFYAVWPLLLVAVVAASRFLHIGRRAAVGLALGVLLIVSFTLSIRMTAHQPEVAFFLPQVRAWEFALGGLVAVLRLPTARTSIASTGRTTGVVAIAVTSAIFSSTTAFPGWAASLPTLGAVLVLAAGSMDPASTPRAVRSLPVQWLGDHSYAIYLWHWPLIVALPWVLHESLGDVAKTLVLVTTLVLAWLTKKYVEDPIRANRDWRVHLAPTFTFAVTAALAVVLASNLVLKHVDHLNKLEEAAAALSIDQGKRCFGASSMTDRNCERRFERPPERTIAFGQGDYLSALNTCQIAVDDGPQPRWCTFGARFDHRSTVALVGNSFATQLVPMVEQWSRGKQVRIRLAARTDCLGLTTAPVSGQAEDDACLGWSRRVQQRLFRIADLSLVVFVTHVSADEFLTGQTNPSRQGVAQARAGVADTLRALRQAGVATVIVKHPPGPWPVRIPACVAVSDNEADPCALPRTQLTSADVLTRFAKGDRSLTDFISLDRFLCDELLCHGTVGDLVAYFDDRHLTTTFARTLAAPIGARLDRAIEAVRR